MVSDTNYLIDSHCHLHPPFFKDGIQEALDRARSHGIFKIVNCAADPDHYEYVVANADNKHVFATLGIQPTYADKMTDAQVLRDFRDLKSSVKAIGEVGLDYYWIKDENLRQRQELLFIDTIQLATELSLPLVIHSRKAETEVLNVLEKHAQTPVLLHSFEGNLKEIERAKDLGYLISIPTNVPKRKNRKKVAKRAGLDTIVLETDAPFCAPTDDIEINEPMYISEVAIYLAKFLEVEKQTFFECTTKNAEKFYRI